MSKRMCSVEGCERPYLASGFCKPHYERNRRNGTPGAGVGPPRWVKPPQWCLVEGCERRLKSDGFCGMHYQRWRKWGDPLFVGEQFGPTHPAWKGSEVGYLGAHRRVFNARGPASDHLCVTCGEAAHEWAYDHADPNELSGVHAQYSDLAYSASPSHYQPMCRSCHRYFDIDHRKRP